MVLLFLWPAYFGSSNSHQPVRTKTQGQQWGEDSYNQHNGHWSRLGENRYNSG